MHKQLDKGLTGMKQLRNGVDCARGNLQGVGDVRRSAMKSLGAPRLSTTAITRTSELGRWIGFD